jgi:hypothetical protein
VRDFSQVGRENGPFWTVDWRLRTEIGTTSVRDAPMRELMRYIACAEAMVKNLVEANRFRKVADRLERIFLGQSGACDDAG